MPAAGGEPRPLPLGSERSSGARFSPDGTRLALVATRAGRRSGAARGPARRGRAGGGARPSPAARPVTAGPPTARRCWCWPRSIRPAAPTWPATRRRTQAAATSAPRHRPAPLPPLGLVAHPQARPPAAPAARRRPGHRPHARRPRRAAGPPRRHRRRGRLSRRRHRLPRRHDRPGGGHLHQRRPLRRPHGRRPGPAAHPRAGLGRLAPAPLPTARRLAWLRQPRAGYESDRRHVMVANPDGGEERDLTARLDLSADSLWWVDGGKALRFTATVAGLTELWEVAGGGRLAAPPLRRAHPPRRPRPVGRRPRRWRCWPTRWWPRPRWRCSPATPPPALRLLTRFGAPVLDALEPVGYRPFTARGRDGVTVHGWLMTPPGHRPGQRHPAVVMIHGGPQGAWNDAWSFRWNPRLWASRGYTVVLPNPRGSTGFGQGYTDAVRDDWGGTPYEDIMALTDAAIASGEADGAPAVRRRRLLRRLHGQLDQRADRPLQVPGDPRRQLRPRGRPTTTPRSSGSRSGSWGGPFESPRGLRPAGRRAASWPAGRPRPWSPTASSTTA